MTAYQEDLAYIHDTGFGDFAKRAAPSLLEMLRQNGIAHGLVIDLGCGSGIWAQALIKAGYEVLGVDISAAMIELARKRAPRARFIQNSFLKLKLPACVAVTALGECFNYRFDQKNDKKALVQLFSRVYQALLPGGLFIFDIAEPGQVSVAWPRMRHSQGKDWAILLKVEEDKKKQHLTRRMTIFRRVGTLYRRTEETHHLQLYKGVDLAKALRRIGFKVRLIRGYGKLRFTRPVVVILARKP